VTAPPGSKLNNSNDIGEQFLSAVPSVMELKYNSLRDSIEVLLARAAR
jgi:hypothetical protein